VSRPTFRPPTPHPSGVQPPPIPKDLLPRHVAIVMDGNGRWAKARGLPRTEGHTRGEASLFDVVEGAIESGVGWLSAYAFSTENWKRSPDEVRFLMGFNRDVIRRRRDEMNALGVRVRWAGRRPRLWRSVIHELEIAEEMTRNNDVLTLTMCVNYGGRAEIADAAREMALDAAAGRLDPAKITEKTLARYLDEPDMPDVDLFVRSSGEQRTSNFLLWQSAYAEMVFQDTLWPDYDRRAFWQALEVYASRDRRYGGAVPNEAQPMVILRLEGWVEGFNSAAMNKALQAHAGMGLAEATGVVDALLRGEAVRLTLDESSADALLDAAVTLGSGGAKETGRR
jgi:undecaprenyl diphosphate synthase